MTIVGATQTTQRVGLTGILASYDITPATDTPSGLMTALKQATFEAADMTQQRESLAALVALENPLSHTAETVACVACHVSTIVMPVRAASGTIDPLTLPGRYTSKYDLSTTGGRSAATPEVIRALGYLRATVLISQRVVNDTAQTLTEIEQRFPPP
jgi:hypothetical protein